MNDTIGNRSPPENSPDEKPSSRGLARRLAAVFAAMVGAQLVGSAFNIWYNLIHIEPLLSDRQYDRFLEAIERYNLAAYPVLVGIWIWVLASLWRWHGKPRRLNRARRRVINLHWTATAIAAAGWLPCIPVLLAALWSGPGELGGQVAFHLTVSVLIAGVIAMTHGFFAVELLSQRLLYPYFFRGTIPTTLSGAWPLSMTGRGMLWAFSAGVCPMIALLLLSLSPSDPGRAGPWFALAVGGMGILFCLTSSILLGKLVVDPVESLREAAERVGAGDESVSITMLRADEFGILANEFNQMVAGLREKEHIRQILGKHVGRVVARRLLDREDDLGGVERVITVLFCDIRGFTARCEHLPPRRAVRLLNRFHEMVTDVVESHGGLVNQILGDGSMCLFGVTEESGPGAEPAVQAGRDLFARLASLNELLRTEEEEPIHIGVGIHTGPAVIGTVGSPRRLVFSAIGDTVNTASRIEALTKSMGASLLVSAATFDLAGAQQSGARPLPTHPIRGREKGIALYALPVEHENAMHS